MRTLILLLATLTCGIAGYFAGGSSFDAAHSVAPAPSIAAGDPPRSLQLVHEALDRHWARRRWIGVGGGMGLAVGFLGTVLAYELSARARRPKVEAP